jgi:hypothetical protein
MKSKLKAYLYLSLACCFTLVCAVPLVKAMQLDAPVNAIGAIAVPGGVGAVDISWVDQARGRLYIADRNRAAVHIVDAANNVYVDLVPGFVGATGIGGGRGGPNGVVVTPDNFLWVGDGNSLLQAVDLNISPPRIGHTISLGDPASDGRADELAYDPFEREILIASDAAHPPKVTFVSADTYSVLGKIDFPDATGMEQPVWDTQLHRFLVTVPSTPGYVAVIDPIKRRLTKKHIIPGCNAGVNGLTLGPQQRLLVSACGNAYIMNAIDGRILTTIAQVGGGDEIWYNAGDNRFYVTAADRTAGLGQSLGVIDAGTSTWLQNIPAPSIRNLAAYVGNNHIFSPVNAPAAGVTDTTACVRFGLVGTGCVIVFGHF